MFISGVGTAVPHRRYTQRECWDALRDTPQLARLARPARALLERVLLGAQGVHTRHLALDDLAEAFVIDADVLHRRYLRHAPALAGRAAQAALRDAGLDASDVDALLISTCTGYLCPGLTSYVSEALGLRPDALLLDLVGQGCGAALPNLRAAEALLASGRCRHALSVCVEVCSAALYIDDDPGVLISGCLFGDGAGAAALSAGPRHGRRRIEWMGAVSLCVPQEREALRMESRGGLLRNILSPRVPQMAAQHASRVLAAGLRQHGLAQRDVRAWILHAGGRTVLQRLRAETALTRGDTRRSEAALARFGNLSSPFVLFVLQAALEEGEADGWWWMSSFGAGFSCHGALLRVSSAGAAS
jgi:predicted naringenin-chalcone synthase